MTAPTFSYWNDEDQARFDAEHKRGGNTSALKPALWSLIVVATLSLAICAGVAVTWAWRVHKADALAHVCRHEAALRRIGRDYKSVAPDFADYAETLHQCEDMQP